MADKISYHPDGQHLIEFNESAHIYKDNAGKVYLSGTTFVGEAFPEFDAVTVSERCSKGKNPKYAGIPPEVIRADWAAYGDMSSMEGTNIHEYAEGKISGCIPENLPTSMSRRCEETFSQVDIIVGKLLKKFVFICAEMVIFSPKLGIAGMVDLIMWNPRTETLLILDWKTNKDLPSKNENAWGRMGFPPIEHLDDIDFYHYTLQLSLYRYMLETEGYFPGITSYNQALIHLSPDAATMIPLDYYKYEIQEMLK